METIRVAVGIAIQNQKVFVTQKGYGPYIGYYEFPGGKIESNETPISALVREMKEELQVSITDIEYFDVFEYAIENVIYRIHAFFYQCSEPFIQTEQLKLLWIPITELDQLHWLESNQAMIQRLMKEYTIN